MRTVRVAAILLALLVHTAGAADWPTYRADAARTGYTAESLPAGLSLHWTYQPRYAPRPAWPTSRRMQFDHAYQPVIAGALLYFGSSADCAVHALDAATGAPRWQFVTDAPVRFAPVVWDGRVFAASDDGHLYCLAAADGKLLWKHRAGPDDRMLLGNGRMVSRWPARGGPAVVDGVVYYAAGIWPSEGIYIYALNARTGKVVWCNDRSGGLEMAQPHGGANAKSGVAAQGYLAVDGDRLLLPTGRAVPAAFNRADGEMQYFRLQRYGHDGGAPAVLIDAYLFASDCVFGAGDGKMILRGIQTATLAASPEFVIRATGDAIEALDRTQAFIEKIEKKGNRKKKVQVPNTKWRIEAPQSGGTALIVAGKTVVSGAPGKVTVIDTASKRVTWTTDVDGNPHGLAVADGRLYVSTDRGTIYCFDASKNPPMLHKAGPALLIDRAAVYAQAAEEIIAKTGITEGYCLDLGCGDGQLACALAKRTKLRIYAVDADADNVRHARSAADGLSGARITVHQRDPAHTGYPNYFADLIVSGRSVTEGAKVVPAEELARLQRPYGGVACTGQPGAMKKAVRGPLAGAGVWTHQYCDPANTATSTDTAVKGPLETLWYDRPTLNIPNRHGRPPSPLFDEGRLFVEGYDAVRALDAYNGRVLWEVPTDGVLMPYDGEHLMGTAGTGSNLCLANGIVYLRHRDRCMRIECATGKVRGELVAPPRPDGKRGTWGYIACADGILFGSLVNEEHLVTTRFGKADMSKLFTESVSFFAMDAETGSVKWIYPAEHSIRNNAVAVGGGRVYLIDRPLAVEVSLREKAPKAKQPSGELLAFDAQTGKVAWRTKDDIYGTMLALSTEHDVVVMSYQATRFRLTSEIGGSLTGFRASDGKRLWDRKADYRSRPLINGRLIIAEPGAWDVLSGTPKWRYDEKNQKSELWRFKRSYGCGTISASPNLMLYRSATLGYYDLAEDKGTLNVGGVRPGCWINVIPAGGLVLMPDATTSCRCSYLNKATVALQPAQRATRPAHDGHE